MAYQTSYKGGFYYGDIHLNDGTLPPCHRDDIECQNNQESFGLEIVLMAVINILVILALVAVYCLCKCQVRRFCDMYKEREKEPEPQETIDKERGSDNNDESHKKGKSST